jgi:hypothetical protein
MLRARHSNTRVSNLYVLLSDSQSEGSATGRLHAAVAMSTHPHILFGLHFIPTSSSFRYLPHFSHFISFSFFSTVRRRILHIFCPLSNIIFFSFVTVIFRVRYTSRDSAWNKVIWQENSPTRFFVIFLFRCSIWGLFKWNPFGDSSCRRSRCH